MYEHIRGEMALGHRIYIVCPFVEESDKVVSRGGPCQQLFQANDQRRCPAC